MQSDDPAPADPQPSEQPPEPIVPDPFDVPERAAPGSAARAAGSHRRLTRDRASARGDRPAVLIASAAFTLCIRLTPLAEMIGLPDTFLIGHRRMSCRGSGGEHGEQKLAHRWQVRGVLQLRSRLPV
jgi:hypothetical protein